MTYAPIGFVGAGNMNGAIIGGLIKSGYAPKAIMASDPNDEKLTALQSTYGIQTCADNTGLVDFAEVIILGVKPQYIATVCNDIRALKPECLVISIAAGIPLATMSAILGAQQPMIRVMPNTPCLVGAGAMGLFANNQVSAAQRELCEQLFQSLGILEWFTDESQMDWVTAISGSGPAYFFYLAEAMIEAAVASGMDAVQAEHLVKQTALGAGMMLNQSNDSAANLRQAVTSPGGTTAAALQAFNSAQMSETVIKGVQAAAARGQQMAREGK